MSHLKDHNVSYFKHMGMAFTLTSFGLKIVFYSAIHAVFPFLFKTEAGHASDNLHRYLGEVRKSRGVVWHDREDKL